MQSDVVRYFSSDVWISLVSVPQDVWGGRGSWASVCRVSRVHSMGAVTCGQAGGLDSLLL
jgi:hypothetical protein